MNQALQQAFHDNKDSLFSFMQKRLQDPQLAEDLLQEIYLKVHQSAQKFEVSYPKAYIYRIANNLVIDTQRKAARQQTQISHDINNDKQDEISPERQLESEQRLFVVSQAIDELPNKTREVFQLQRLKQIDKREVAVRLDISVNMVEKHLRRALQHCRDKLKKWEK